MADPFLDELSGIDLGIDSNLNPVQKTWRKTVRPFLEQEPPWLKGTGVAEEAYSGAIRGLTFENIKPDIRQPEGLGERFAYHAANLGGFGVSLAGIGAATGAPTPVLGFIAGALHDTGEDVGSQADAIARVKAGAWMGAQFLALEGAGHVINKNVTSKLFQGVLKDLADNPLKKGIIERIVSDAIIGSGLGAMEPTQMSKLSPSGFQEMIGNAVFGGATFVAGSALGEQALRGVAGGMETKLRNNTEEALYTATAFNRQKEAMPIRDLRKQMNEGGILRQMYPADFARRGMTEFNKKAAYLEASMPKMADLGFASSYATGTADIPATKLSQNIKEGPKVPEPPSSKEVSPIRKFAERIASGEKMTSPEDMQYHINNAKEIEKNLRDIYNEKYQGGGTELRKGKNAIRLETIDTKLKSLGMSRGKRLEMKQILKDVPEAMREDILKQLYEAPDAKQFSFLLGLSSKLGAYVESSSRQNFLDTLKTNRTLDKFSDQKDDKGHSDLDRLDALRLFSNSANQKEVNKFADEMFAHIPKSETEKKLAKQKMTEADIAMKETARQKGIAVKKTDKAADTGAKLIAKDRFDKLAPELLTMVVAQQEAVKDQIGSSKDAKRLLDEFVQKQFQGWAKELGMYPEDWKLVKKWYDDRTANLNKKELKDAAKDESRGIKTVVITPEVADFSERVDKVTVVKPTKVPELSTKPENLHEVAWRQTSLSNAFGAINGEKTLGGIHGMEETWDKNGVMDTPNSVPFIDKVIPELKSLATKAGKRWKLMENKELGTKDLYIYDSEKLQAVLKKNGIKMSADNFIQAQHDQNFEPGSKESRAIAEVYGPQRSTDREVLDGKPIIKVDSDQAALEKGKIEAESSSMLDEIPEGEFEPTPGAVHMTVSNKRLTGKSETAPPVREDLFTDAYDGLQMADLGSGVYVELDSEGMKNLKIENTGAVQVFSGGKFSDHTISITNQTDIPYSRVWLTEGGDASNKLFWARKALKEGKPVMRVKKESLNLEKASSFDIQPALKLAEDLNGLWRLGVIRGQREGDSALHDIAPIISIAANLRAFALNPVNQHVTVGEALDSVVMGNLQQTIADKSGQEQQAFLQTPQWAAFMKSYNPQDMLQLLRSQGLFKAGTHADMPVADAIKLDQNVHEQVVSAASKAFRAKKYAAPMDHTAYQEQVDRQGFDKMDPVQFEAQLYTFLNQTQGLLRTEGGESLLPEHSSAMKALDIQTDNNIIRSQADWYKRKIVEIYQTQQKFKVGNKKYKLGDMPGIVDDFAAAMKAFSEAHDMLRDGDMTMPFERLLALRTELKTELLREHFVPKRVISADMMKKNLKYVVTGLDNYRRALGWQDALMTLSDDSPMMQILRANMKNRKGFPVTGIEANRGEQRVFGIEAGQYGKSYVAKKYSAGYTAHDNKMNKLTSQISYLDALMDIGKTSLIPASEGTNVFHIGRVVMSQGERADSQAELAHVTEALGAKATEIARNTNPERAQQLEQERSMLEDRMHELHSSLTGIKAAGSMIEGIPVGNVSKGTPLSQSKSQALKDIGEHYRQKTSNPEGSPWLQTVGQWAMDFNKGLGQRGNRGFATITDDTGNFFPMFKKVGEAFSGMLGFPSKPASNAEEVLKRNQKSTEKRQGKEFAQRALWDVVRDSVNSRSGMFYEVKKAVEQKAKDLDLVSRFGEPISKRYDKKLLNKNYWMEGLTGRMGANYRDEAKRMAPYLTDLNIAMEAIAILDPTQPHIYSFTREADRINPVTGLSKRETFENLPPHAKQWIVQNAADYRKMLDRGLDMGFFDNPDAIMESYYKNGFNHTMPLSRKTGLPMSDAFDMDPTVRPSMTQYKSKSSIIDRQASGMPEVLNPVVQFENYSKDFVRRVQYEEIKRRLEREVADNTGLPLLAFETGGRTRIGGSSYTGKELRDAGYEQLKGGTPFSRFNVQTKMREDAWVHPEIKPHLEALYGSDFPDTSPLMKTLQRVKGVTRSVTLWGPFDNIMYTIGALNGAMGPLDTLKATFGPKSWLNWKNTYSEELKMEMAKAGVNTASYTQFLRGLYDNFKEGSLAYNPEEKGVLNRAWQVLEGVAHEKGGIDETLFHVIDNASAFMYQKTRDKFMAEGMSKDKAASLAADYVNTALYVPHEYTFGKHTSAAARWLLISRNMSFTRIRMFTGAIDPEFSAFGQWFNRNFAFHGLDKSEQKLLQRQFQDHLLRNAVTFGLGTAMISYMMTKANTGQGKFPWEYEDPADWWKIHTGQPHPTDPNGRELVISNPLMKDFTDVTSFAQLPANALTFEPPAYILNKTDMTIKALLNAYVGGKILPSGVMDMTPPGSPTTFKVNAMLENMMVDNGPLNPFKPALDELEGDKQNWDPISLVSQLMGFKMGKGTGPAEGAEQYKMMQNEIDRVSFFKKQARKEMNDLVASGRATPERLNELRMYMAMSPSQLMKAQMRMQNPLFVKSQEYMKLMGKSAGIQMYANE